MFWSVLLNKIARNAFYYTFSRWLSETYGLGPQQAGYITLFVAMGCLVGTTVVPFTVNKLGVSIHMACVSGSILQVLAMTAEPLCVLFGGQVSLAGAAVVIFFYFSGCQIWYNNILDIMIGVTPRPQLLPAVNTILLAYGAFGGMVGTIGSTVWHQWGGEVLIATVCALCNVGVSCIVVLLWIAHKQHPYLRHRESLGTEGAATKMEATAKRVRGSKVANYESIKMNDDEPSISDHGAEIADDLEMDPERRGLVEDATN